MAGFELPFSKFRDLERMAPDFAQDLSGANQLGHAYAHDAGGPIGKGLVHIVEFEPAYLKSHKFKPNQEIAHKTPQGELHIHFDADGLPAGADLNLGRRGGHEHVTANSQGRIMADDRFNRDGVMTAHIGFDDQHRLTEVKIDAEHFDQKGNDLGPLHLAYKWDAQQHLVYAKSDEGNGIEILRNEPGKKTIFTSNPAEGTDRDTYIYNLKTNKLDHLDVIDQDGKEYSVSGKPDGSLDIEPVIRT
jgi:hypothetical protein